MLYLVWQQVSSAYQKSIVSRSRRQYSNDVISEQAMQNCIKTFLLYLSQQATEMLAGLVGREESNRVILAYTE